MIYKNQYGIVDFWTPHNLERFSKIGINLSGGCDSSLLLFFTLKELKPHQTIIPITGVHNARPANIWNVEEIVLLMRELFPDKNIGEHAIDHYDKDFEKDKVNKHREHEQRLWDSKTIEVLFHGRTANPPVEEAETHNLTFKRESQRDGNEKFVYHENHNRPFYVPFNNVDKRFIAENYKKFNLMEELFPITGSCVGYAEATDNFSKPCRVCWWCREKKWAFGMYDGGVK